MEEKNLNPDYWNAHYQHWDTPWDIGHASPPLISYLEKEQQKSKRILFPGAGRAHEAIYMHRMGFTEIYVCDWAEKALDYLKRQQPDFPTGHLLVGDFFDLEPAFDLIIEQTFFCAILPEQRPAYARKCHELLHPKGKLAGLLFASVFPFPGPPFGGTRAEYEAIFSPYFSLNHLEIAKNSIPPRLGNELFFEFSKK